MNKPFRYIFLFLSLTFTLKANETVRLPNEIKQSYNIATTAYYATAASLLMIETNPFEGSPSVKDIINKINLIAAQCIAFVDTMREAQIDVFWQLFDTILQTSLIHLMSKAGRSTSIKILYNPAVTSSIFCTFIKTAAQSFVKDIPNRIKRRLIRSIVYGLTEGFLKIVYHYEEKNSSFDASKALTKEIIKHLTREFLAESAIRSYQHS